jgi:hypothetical protein
MMHDAAKVRVDWDGMTLFGELEHVKTYLRQSGGDDALQSDLGHLQN